jgi:hypothetical protein
MTGARLRAYPQIDFARSPKDAPSPLVRAARVGRGTVPNPWTGFRIRTPDTEAGNLETGSIVERLENRIYLRIG